MGAALAVLALALTACTSSNEVVQPVQPAKRPNIVFVLTDDLAMNLLKYMPHVQAMQRAGSTMSHYYVVDSLCCPSRTAILTGKYPHDDGVFTNAGADGGFAAFNKHDNAPDTFGVALQKAGYRTALMGKYLNGYFADKARPPGWNEWSVAGNGYYEYNYDLNVDGRTEHKGIWPDDYLTDVIAGRGSQFIKNSARAGKPFALELATFAPHHPSTPAPQDLGKFPGLKAPRTAAYDRLPRNAPSWLRNFPPLKSYGQRNIDQQFRLRVQSVQAVDRMIGHLWDELRSLGIADNTYLVFSSDNGYHMGEHRLRPGKQTAFDTDIQVPLVVVGPGVPAGRVVPQMTSSIDIAPTFESLAGAPTPASTDGTSLLGLWHGQRPDAWQQAVLIEHHGPNTAPDDPDLTKRLGGNPPSYEAVRTEDALYVRYASGEQEYYDTARDPAELDNLGNAVPPVLQRTLTKLSTCHGTAACQAAARLD